MRRFKWMMLGLAGLGLLLIAGLTARSRVLVGAGAPPTCGGSATPGAAQPLHTAADFMAQGDQDFDQGNCRAAIAAYTQAIALDPSLAEAYNNRAYTYMAEQDYADALPDLNHAIALRPDYVNALMNRGDLYNYYGDVDSALALADYDRVLALNPSGQGTSVCGHRLLAEHHGWNLGTLAELVIRGTQAGCN